MKYAPTLFMLVMYFLLFTSCAANSYIMTPLIVKAVYEYDGKTVIQVEGLDSKNQLTYAQFIADKSYSVGDTLYLTK